MKSPFAVPQAMYTRQLRELVAQALAEDVGKGDLTVNALRLGNTRAHASIVAKSSGILAGADAVAATFRALDRGTRITWKLTEGRSVRRGQNVAVITALPQALLSGERTALNFLSRLSGVASSTHALAKYLRGTRTKLLDTRKTTPGWRFLEKHAAGIGGAVNHRIGLHDALMIKSNHVVAVGDFAETVRRAVSRTGKRVLICEVRSIPEVRTALELGVPWLLLDHFRGQRLRHAISIIRQSDVANNRRGTHRTVIEVSGNIDKRSIAAIASHGPDFVSSGAITHSAVAVDFSLTWE